jgi:hypothetical protein
MRILAAAVLMIPGVFAQNVLPSLKTIQKVYVDKMPNDLDQYIRAEITKQFKGKLVVVASACPWSFYISAR